MTASGFFRTLGYTLAFAAALPLAANAHAHPGPAPADEYFGPFKQSILGIRNHINDFEAKAEAEFSPDRVLTGIDNLEDAIEDWHAQYPHDSWVPKFLSRVVHLYARCHSVTHQQAQRALGLLERDFSGTAYAKDARSLVDAELSSANPTP